MINFKKHLLISLTLVFLFSFTVLNAQDSEIQTTEEPEFELPKEPVEFTQEDLEMVKTLIERHYNTRISPIEFEKFGDATEKNLKLFKHIDENQKEDPFFSQDHISFIIDSMEERLGKKRPKSKFDQKPNINEEETTASDVKPTKKGKRRKRKL